MAVVLAGCTAIGRMLAVGVVRLGVAGPGCGCGAGCWAGSAPRAPPPPPDMGRMLAVGAVRPDWSPEQSGTGTGLACCPNTHTQGGGHVRSVRSQRHDAAAAYNSTANSILRTRTAPIRHPVAPKHYHTLWPGAADISTRLKFRATQSVTSSTDSYAN